MTIAVMNEIQVSIDNYLNYKFAEGLAKTTLDDVRYRLKAFIRDIGAETWSDVSEDKAIEWFTHKGSIDEITGKAIFSPNTRKLNWVYVNGFFNWCVEMGLIENNPVEKAPRPKNFRKDRRKMRRAMNADELERLILVAKYRPLAEYCKARSIGSRHKDFWDANPITIDNVFALADYALQIRGSRLITDKLAKDGEKWSLAYRMLALSGLRWGELRALRVGRIDLTKRSIFLDSNYVKNSSEDVLPLPMELIADLRQWILSNNLGPNDLLFRLRKNGVPRFYRDIEVAGIPKVDERGKCVDIHSLRYSFGTMLARQSVPIAVAQKLMRHSDPKLTIGIYTDANCLDYQGASDSLPALGSTGEPVAVPVKEDPKSVAPAGPTVSANDGLLKALLKNADPELLRKSLLESMGQ